MLQLEHADVCGDFGHSLVVECYLGAEIFPYWY
jgi:hypothetical protein